MKTHPALEDTCDTVLSLLSGSLVLPAVGFVWIKELVGRNPKKIERNSVGQKVSVAGRCGGIIVEKSK